MQGVLSYVCDCMFNAYFDRDLEDFVCMSCSFDDVNYGLEFLLDARNYEIPEWYTEDFVENNC